VTANTSLVQVTRTQTHAYVSVNAAELQKIYQLKKPESGGTTVVVL